MSLIRKLLSTATPVAKDLSPALFTPGMITNQKLWSAVWPLLPTRQQKLFAGFDNASATLESHLHELHQIKPTQPFDLIGFSMGGYLSIEYALQHPELLSSLVLISSSARGYSPSEIEARKKLLDNARQQFDKMLSDERLNHWLAAHGENNAAILAQLREMASSAGVERFINQQTATLNRADRRAQLRDLSLPVLIIHGAADKLIPVKHAESLAQEIPNAELVVIPAAGHMIPLEQPQALADALSNWFLTQKLSVEKKIMSHTRTEDKKKIDDTELNVYTLRRGKAGEERLGVLNGIYNQDSEKFLLDNGIMQAKHVVDVGCGTGQMACWIAKTNPDCHVTCLDISAGQIEVTKKNAEKEGLTNMSFDVVSIYELSQLNQKFDFVYTRFVLAHLDQPSKALQSIASIMTPGAVFACEEAKTSEHLCSVDDPDFKRYYEIWSGLRIKKGADPEFGTKLAFIANQAGIVIPGHHVVTRDLTAASGLRSIFTHNLHEIGSEAIRLGLTTQTELDALIPAIEKLNQRDDINMRFSASVQAAGVKPALELEQDYTSTAHRLM